MTLQDLKIGLSAPVQGRSYLLAIFSGVLLALSFPKPGFSLLAWFAFVPLFSAVVRATPRQAFRLGFVSGIVAYGGIVYWLTIVMTSYGNLPQLLSIFLTLVMAAYLALYPAVTCLLVRSLKSGPLFSGLAFPLFWTGLEYLRSFAFTGFPWASLGYSQYKTLPIIQIADLAGVYGVSFLILLVNVTIFIFIRTFIRGERGGRSLQVVAVTVVLLASTIWYGFEQLNTPETGAPLKVALVQGNISQDVKWDPAFQEQTVAIYERLTRSAADYSPDLTVWPESATPFFFQSEEAYAGRVSALARELKSPLIFGSPAMERELGDPRFLNSAFLLSAAGELVGRSDKIHLVPFGEYVPLKRILPFVNKLVEGIGDFSPGRSARPLDTGKTKVGVLVCFEGIFPELSRAYVNAGAGLLVNISNDAWYKLSSAPYQHLSMTVFRAVENRVPLVRATNTGISAIIDSRGHFHGTTPLFREAVLTGEVRPGAGGTFYNRFGDLFAKGCLLVTALTGLAIIFELLKERRFSRS